ncbi:hypothetical protein GALMADRAFT_243686 [Galerina marginata CBS 339.88]|uniref:Ubiquinol-cytochrome c chaperone domain-containing protein n=1 Tax=Galerina marginata (strain CBS 339.88) TaxID=685588 RepID=A0A067TKT9_GALM3|nr:hypothetical protein GALMADRAFT_243686 [Galerina marginata CBS 339.88]
MVARSILLRQLRSNITPYSVSLPATRCLATKRSSKLTPSPAGAAPKPTANAPTSQSSPVPEEPKSWLTRKVETSPAARNAFIGLTNLLGYGSDKQVAGRRARGFYEEICAVMPDKERDFWINDCFLPPTFQSWFTVTNLHIWMLTVRLRALPQEHGKPYQQALVDHFFIDIEDRIRTVLQPPAEPTKPYTFDSPFYVKPNVPSPGATLPNGKPKPLGRAPDRIVTQQMKIFKEQWTGMGLSFDVGLVKGDMEMAGAVWRNLLGARGAQGIDYADANPSTTAVYRRAVNLVGGEVVNVAKIDLDKEEVTDDGSGVHDFPPSETDRYLSYPEVMLDVVGYVRRELARLERVSDEDIISGDWRKLAFGRVK